MAEGAWPESLRLYVPDDIVVFSLLDARRPGFASALETARAHGCGAVLRLAGGHAALFHRGCLAFSWAIPDERPRDGIRARFEQLSAWVAAALTRIGVDARVGEVAGEYCPGQYSVNAGGSIKLMGVGQRVIRGAAHVGGVIVAEDANRVREVLGPVYRALELEWDPASAGAVADVATGATPGTIREALVEELRITHAPEWACFDAATLARADELMSWHEPAGDRSTDAHSPLGTKTVAVGPAPD
ncbi:MAG: lipoate--protein ligase family protein [Deltaproteobacteria bacterium]|nr:lipoate--protein ligase family protein [Deltaproteobacteria bacterium]MBW2695110.1 lipoate--protein ligase family protein [Deltaproteobacteria bacterium]